MSGHRGVLAAVALLLLAALPACGYADDNYENAQNALDRSKPNLTVPETVTTMKPFQTLPGEATADSIPVELATPEQRAAALAEAQRRIDDRKAGRTGAAAGGTTGTGGTGTGTGAAGTGATTSGGSAAGGRGGATTPSGTTSTTLPDSPSCNASRQLQVVGGMVVLAPKDSLPAYRDSITALAGVWRQIQLAVPAANRPLVDGVVVAYLNVQQKALFATTTAQVRAELMTFLQSQSKQITKVLTVLTSLCPQVITAGQDQAETINLNG